MSNATWRLFSDGGARGNPGPAAIGAVLLKDGEKVAEISRAIGETTNNQAEYQALIAGLEEAKKFGAEEIDCFLDSLLVVSQLNGQWKVKEPSLRDIFEKACQMKKSFAKISFSYIPREKNKKADALVNQALDKKD
jgi:probable phosphoglycerate mutase